MRHLKLFAFILLSSVISKASYLEFHCVAYVGYNLVDSGIIHIDSTIEGTPGATAVAYPSLSAQERTIVTQQVTNTCLSWGQAMLNSLPASSFAVGQQAFVNGAGYLWVFNKTSGFNIVFNGQYIAKTSAPVIKPISPCARLPWYKRDICEQQYQ